MVDDKCNVNQAHSKPDIITKHNKRNVTYSHNSIPFSKPPLKSFSPKHLPVTAYRREGETCLKSKNTNSNDSSIKSRHFTLWSLRNKPWPLATFFPRLWCKSKRTVWSHVQRAAGCISSPSRLTVLNTNRLDISCHHPDQTALAA